MTRLFGHKWVSKEGEFPEILTGGFIEKGHPNAYGISVWMEAVKDLTDNQWRQAVDRVERQVRENAITGDQSWPPSYEEFAAYAKESKARGHKYFAHSLPEPKEDREKRKEAGRKHCSRLLSIIDE